MTYTPKHAQFTVDARLQNHLTENGGALSDLLSAIRNPTAQAALSNLRSGDVCCANCQVRHVGLILECLLQTDEIEAATRPDFDAAVRWHGARIAEVHSALVRRN